MKGCESRDGIKDLVLEHVQVDELYASVRGEEGRSWVWAGIEPRTKIVPGIHVGQRTTEDTCVIANPENVGAGASREALRIHLTGSMPG